MVLKSIRGKPKLWLPPIIWMAVIFIFSSFSSLEVETFVPDFYLRKGAHLFEYATLSLLYYRAINKGLKVGAFTPAFWL